MTIKFSAILPNYNDAVTLSKAIQSLIDQSEPFTEIIIVDDGSTDNSLSVIRDFVKRHSHIKCISLDKNQGVVTATNQGILQAAGDYILLCAADDLYHHSCVATAKSVIEQYPDIGVVCGDAMIHDLNKNCSFKRTLPLLKNHFYNNEAFQFYANHHFVDFNGGGSLFMKRQTMIEAGLLQPEVRWHSDWLLYCSVAFLKGVYYTDTVFVDISVRKQGYSEGKRNFKIQKQVMLSMMRVLKNSPMLFESFKLASLLPCYSTRYLLFCLFEPAWRQFLSLKLLWKLLVNNSMVIKLSRLFPYYLILKVRELLKA